MDPGNLAINGLAEGAEPQDGGKQADIVITAAQKLGRAINFVRNAGQNCGNNTCFHIGTDVPHGKGHLQLYNLDEFGNINGA